MDQPRARFRIGQPIHHLKFGYRGVVIDVDPQFAGTDEWYDRVARSRPPKDKPWYHVLVHDSPTMTYVAERHLEPDLSGEPVVNPSLSDYFDAFDAGLYVRRRGLH